MTETTTTTTTKQQQQQTPQTQVVVPLATSALATLSPPSMMSMNLDQQQQQQLQQQYRIPTTRITVSKRPTTTSSRTTSTDSSLPSLTNLSERLVGDVAVGTAITAVVAPFLTVVDKALVQRSNGSASLLGSAFTSLTHMVKHPITYLKSPTYLWMWGCYAATYSTANALRTITEHREYSALKQASRDQKQRVLAQQKQATTATLFVGTTIVNSTGSVIKDQAYARMFGNASTSVVPRISYALWATRDLTVIGSSFILPEYVSQYLQSNHDVSEEKATTISQIGTPLLAQVIAGPLHFVGLDCYNRNLSNLSMQQRFAERSRFLAGGFVEVVAARMARILPGYGIAGIGNKMLRTKYREMLIQNKVKNLVVGQKKQSSAAGAGDLVALIRAKKEV